MTLEDINDPKWVVYDKAKPVKKAVEDEPSLRELREQIQKDGRLDDLLLAMGWDIIGSTFYERMISETHLLRISFSCVRSTTQKFIVQPHVLQKNPDYDSANKDSRAYIDAGKPIPNYKTTDRTKAETYLWDLLNRYDKIFFEDKK